MPTDSPKLCSLDGETEVWPLGQGLGSPSHGPGPHCLHTGALPSQQNIAVHLKLIKYYGNYTLKSFENIF